MKDFLEILTELKKTHVSLLLIGGGILFLFIAVGGQIGGKISADTNKVKQGAAAILGGILLFLGVALYIVPIVVVSPSSTPTLHSSTVTPMPSTKPTLVKTTTISPSQTSIPKIVSTPTPSSPISTGEENFREKDQAMMVYVQSGTFNMGSSDKQVKEAIESCEQARKNLTSDQQDSYLCEFEDFADESPLHQVHINAFWLDKTEVTNAQFATFLNEQDDQTNVSEWVDLEDKCHTSIHRVKKLDIY